MVYGVIEVKTTITKAEVKLALKTCAQLRKMAGTKNEPNKAYLRQKPPAERTAVSTNIRRNTSLRDSFFLATRVQASEG